MHDHARLQGHKATKRYNKSSRYSVARIPQVHLINQDLLLSNTSTLEIHKKSIAAGKKVEAHHIQIKERKRQRKEIKNNLKDGHASKLRNEVERRSTASSEETKKTTTIVAV